MFNKLILFAVIGGLVYLNYTNPTREDHEESLLAELQARGPVSEEQFALALRELDYSNFMVCSATKTTMESRMISLGYLGKVELVDEQWFTMTAQKLQGRRY